MLDSPSSCGWGKVAFMGRIRRAISWCWTHFSNIAMLIGWAMSFALPAWATYAANLFQQYFPLSWVIAGFIGAGAWVLFLRTYQSARRMRLMNQYYEDVRRTSDTVNPLETVFTNKRINIRDLMPPIGSEIRGRTFVKCDIVGPANLVVWDDVNISEASGQNVDGVLLSENPRYFNSIFLVKCDFRQCMFYNITFLVHRSQYHYFNSALVVPWITDIPQELQPQLNLPAPASPAEESAHSPPPDTATEKPQ